MLDAGKSVVALMGPHDAAGGAALDEGSGKETEENPLGMGMDARGVGEDSTATSLAIDSGGALAAADELGPRGFDATPEGSAEADGGPTVMDIGVELEALGTIDPGGFPHGDCAVADGISAEDTGAL